MSWLGFLLVQKTALSNTLKSCQVMFWRLLYNREDREASEENAKFFCKLVPFRLSKLFNTIFIPNLIQNLVFGKEKSQILNEIRYTSIIKILCVFFACFAIFAVYQWGTDFHESKLTKILKPH